MTQTALEIPGWMTVTELNWLSEKASKHKSIVEIGCHLGRSTAALAYTCPGHVYAVDTWDGDVYDEFGDKMGVDGKKIMEDFYQNLDSYIKTNKVKPFRGTINKFAILGRQPDMIFIDADHRYESVKNDILTALDMMPNGLLCGHDYGVKTWPGVKYAVDELFVEPVIVPGTTIWQVQIGEYNERY